MGNLKEVKGRIQSVVSTQQITKAMKMVAAAKLRKAQNRLIQMRPYSKKLSEIIQNISSGGAMDVVNNPYAEQQTINKVLLVAISSDRGLCGSFNSHVFKRTKDLITEKYSHLENSENLKIMTIGKKSFEFFFKRGYHVIDTYSHLIENLNFSDTKEAVEMIMESFVEGKYDCIEIVYNSFKNVAIQTVQTEIFFFF